MKKINLLIINNSQVSSNDFSGGERIAIEVSKRLANNFKISLLTSNFGKKIWQKYQVNNVKIVALLSFSKKSSVFSYFKRAILGMIWVLKNKDEFNIVYSASDFWPDAVPAAVLKIIKPEIKWVAGFYLFAPKPWQKNSPYRNWQKLTGFFYWFTQQPIYWLVKKMANQVWVTSQPDVKKFITSYRKRTKIIVVRGGVDFKLYQMVSKQKIKYEAVFIGRLHPQKGVLKLINIWQKVVAQKSKAKLAIIGSGPLKKAVENKIKKLNLGENIELLGFLDGKPKIKVFKSSRIVIHPATYDSGGMAAMEAMAAGLPGISFDLEALKTYYPQGMMKTPCYDLDKFAANIIKLLNNKSLYLKLKKEVLNLAAQWDWDEKAKFLSKKLIN